MPSLGCKTDDLLVCHEYYGVVNDVQGDRATQLVKASQTLAREKDGPSSWEWQKIVSITRALNWSFMPVGSDHRHGLPKSKAKMRNRSMSQPICSSVTLNFAEIITILAKISKSMNDRPLGLNDTFNVDELISLI